MNEQLLAEIKALRSEVAELRNALPGLKSPYISGSAASRILGVSYPTFKRRYIDTGIIRPAKGRRFRKGDIVRLKETS